MYRSLLQCLKSNFLVDLSNILALFQAYKSTRYLVLNSVIPWSNLFYLHLARPRDMTRAVRYLAAYCILYALIGMLDIGIN